jgi:hypothetical protein
VQLVETRRTFLLQLTATAKGTLDSLRRANKHLRGITVRLERKQHLPRAPIIITPTNLVIDLRLLEPAIEIESYLRRCWSRWIAWNTPDENQCVSGGTTDVRKTELQLL